jgi:hypothetical protein
LSIGLYNFNDKLFYKVYGNTFSFLGDEKFDGYDYFKNMPELIKISSTYTYIISENLKLIIKQIVCFTYNYIFFMYCVTKILKIKNLIIKMPDMKILISGFII